MNNLGLIIRMAKMAELLFFLPEGAHRPFEAKPCQGESQEMMVDGVTEA